MRTVMSLWLAGCPKVHDTIVGTPADGPTVPDPDIDRIEGTGCDDLIHGDPSPGPGLDPSPG